MPVHPRHHQRICYSPPPSSRRLAAICFARWQPACAAHVADPAVELDNVYILALRARVFAVMLGMDEALESAGFDDRSYDLSSALHEALTNSLCRTLWLRQKAAFPDSCLSPE